MVRKLTIEKQKKLHYTISPFNKPVLSLKPGETVSVETEDASSGQVRTLGDVRDRTKVPNSNPQSGPIYVEGAVKGDTLVVQIKDIVPAAGSCGASWLNYWWWYLGHNPSAVSMNRFAGLEIPDRTRVYTIQDGRIIINDKIAIQYQPMIGTIGTAPEEEAVTSYLPGPHGGNMDISDITIGCSLHLPVFVDGALLHMGDAHAAQGDGEISGTAIEIPSVTTLTVNLIKDKAIRWPRIETLNEIGVIVCSGTGRTLEDAIRLAYVELIDWLELEHGFDRHDALQCSSFLGRVRLGNIWSVAVKFPKEFLR